MPAHATETDRERTSARLQRCSPFTFFLPLADPTPYGHKSRYVPKPQPPHVMEQCNGFWLIAKLNTRRRRAPGPAPVQESGQRREGDSSPFADGFNAPHQLCYLPSPMAAQVISVIMTREQLWQRWALGFLCLRSQQRVSRYSSSPSSERISIPAGMEASMPRL